MTYHPSLYYKNKQPVDRHFEFESRNLLPVFWLTLLDKAIIHQLKSKLSYVERLLPDESGYERFMNDEASVPYFELEISAAAFKLNSRNGERYISQIYPEKLELYQEFIQFISIDGDESIAINVYDLFDNSAQTVIDYLLGELRIIREQRQLTISDPTAEGETPYFLIGYSEEFAAYSPPYYQWLSELERHVGAGKCPGLKKNWARNLRHGLLQIMSVLTIAAAAMAFAAFYLFVLDQEIYSVVTLMLLPLGILLLYLAYRITD